MNDIVKEALSWKGTPYHHQGWIKGIGVDCAFFLIKVFHICGYIPDLDPRPYSPDWMLHRSEERYLRWVEEYSSQVNNPMPGDIALFKFGRCISHGAIVVEWPEIIHAYLPERGVVVSNATRDDLRERLRGFWRVKS